MRSVLVLGSGFAGLWAAIGAARRIADLGATDVKVTVISAEGFHDIRVRNYEADISDCRIPLNRVLDPIGVAQVTGRVEAIDTVAHTVTVVAAPDGGDRTDAVDTPGAPLTLPYDKLVLAVGSRLVRPDLPGLGEFTFDVDTYPAAVRLNEHLNSLPLGPPHSGAATVIVVGAGLTGIETACEMPVKLAKAWAGHAQRPDLRVILMDHNPRVGSDMGESARPVIEQALTRLGVEMVTGVRVAAVDAGGVVLESGDRWEAATVVWCAGMRANPLTRQFGVERDRLGRLPVDDILRVIGVDDVFAAGDVAVAKMDDEHFSVMSCQHGRPMGRFAGYNVVSDLLGQPALPLRIPWYVTVLDLGPAGAVYTEGWGRRVISQGAEAKLTKQIINTERIYPPLTGDRAAILAAAAPVVQTRPPSNHRSGASEKAQ